MPTTLVERRETEANLSESSFQGLRRRLSHARSVSMSMSDALVNPAELMDRLATVVQDRIRARGADRMRSAGRSVIASLRMAKLGTKPAQEQRDELQRDSRGPITCVKAATK